MDALLALFVPAVIVFLLFRVIPAAARTTPKPDANSGAMTAKSKFATHTTPAALQAMYNALPGFLPSSLRRNAHGHTDWLFPRMPTPRMTPLLRAVGYDAKLQRGRECAGVNAGVVREMGRSVSGLLPPSPPPAGWWDRWLGGGGGGGTTPDATRIRETLRHVVRDWSTEGADERARVFQPILDALPVDATGRVLVPGCGLGRLAHDVASARPACDVIAVEMSPYMNVVRRALVDGNVSGTIHPYAWWWSHQRSNDSTFRGISFPDVQPQPLPNLAFLEGDFLELTPTYSTIITLFFIDALPNPVRTLTHIASLLPSGGTWINLGPLLYGSGGKPQDRIELSLEEVVRLAERVGFRFEGEDKTRTIECEYTADDRAMMQWLYRAEFWVARKV